MLNTTKYGNCPPHNPAKTSFDSICMDTCGGYDYKCPGIQKCCQHQCGRTCQMAENLDLVPHTILPAIPENVTVVYSNSRNMAEIRWQLRSEVAKPKNFYVIEARAHAGYIFAEHKLSKWFNASWELIFSSIHTENGYTIFG